MITLKSVVYSITSFLRWLAFEIFIPDLIDHTDDAPGHKYHKNDQRDAEDEYLQVQQPGQNLLHPG